MYADNARNRMLTFGIVLIVVMSLSYNIKQLFDVKRYQQLASDTQVLLSGMIPITADITSTAINNVLVSKAELQCMAENIYFESASQSLVGKFAVGHVVLNRMANPKYPKTVCGVVNHKIGNTCMFSWKCEGPKGTKNQAAWKQSQQVAYELLSRRRSDLVDITDGATHFHAVRLKTNWKLQVVTKIDDHVFYK
jgi:spore germination cell wall hydrolase CwlJ-like protein